MAIEITKLRVWLSLIIDQKPNGEELPTLPNLEFKFVCANSLIDYEKQIKSNSTFESMRNNYFYPDGRKNKVTLQQDIRIKIRDSFFSNENQKYNPFNYSTNCIFF